MLAQDLPFGRDSDPLRIIRRLTDQSVKKPARYSGRRRCCITRRSDSICGICRLVYRRAAMVAANPAGQGITFYRYDSRIKALELPPEIQVDPHLIKQHWHGRNHQDEANQWLRKALVKLFLDRREDYPIEISVA